MNESNLTRRVFLARSIGGIGLGAAGLAGLAGLARPAPLLAQAGSPGPAKPAGITPNEDLSREHGVIVRLLLVFAEAAKRLKAGKQQPPQDLAKVLASGLDIMQSFGHDYHEGLEEQFVFPRFDGTDLEGLAKTLFDQHVASREITSRLQDLVKGGLEGAKGRQAASLMESTARMYYPHIGWEESVLFPAFRSRLSSEEYAGLEGQFMEQKTSILGQDGFNKALQTLASLEKDLGIGNLAQYTVKAGAAGK